MPATCRFCGTTIGGGTECVSCRGLRTVACPECLALDGKRRKAYRPSRKDPHPTCPKCGNARQVLLDKLRSASSAACEETTAEPLFDWVPKDES